MSFPEAVRYCSGEVWLAGTCPAPVVRRVLPNEPVSFITPSCFCCFFLFLLLAGAWEVCCSVSVSPFCPGAFFYLPRGG